MYGGEGEWRLGVPSRAGERKAPSRSPNVPRSTWLVASLCLRPSGDGPVPPPAPEAPLPSPDYTWDEHGRKVLKDGEGERSRDPAPGFDFGFLSAEAGPGEAGEGEAKRVDGLDMSPAEKVCARRLGGGGEDDGGGGAAFFFFWGGGCDLLLPRNPTHPSAACGLAFSLGEGGATTPLPPRSHQCVPAS
jgi:hypothetical protein